MRRLVRKIQADILRSDNMNRTFSQLRFRRRFFLAWSLTMGGILLVSNSMLPPFLTDPTLRLLHLVALSGTLFSLTYTMSVSIELDALRRELWFIKHRLGLPLDPEELEDVEAYQKWMEEYIRKNVGGEGS